MTYEWTDIGAEHILYWPIKKHLVKSAPSLDENLLYKTMTYTINNYFQA